MAGRERKNQIAMRSGGGLAQVGRLGSMVAVEVGKMGEMFIWRGWTEEIMADGVSSECRAERS